MKHHYAGNFTLALALASAAAACSGAETPTPGGGGGSSVTGGVPPATGGTLGSGGVAPVTVGGPSTGGQSSAGSGSTSTKLVAVALAAGKHGSNAYATTCAVLIDGTIECWGDGESLGNGTWGDAACSCSKTPVKVSGISDAVTVAVGYSFACAVLRSGTIECWGGNNNYGELGNGTTTGSKVPVTVSGISDAVAVAAGAFHACAALRSGTVECWGSSWDAANATSTVPVTVSGISDAVAVAAGPYHTCAMLRGGTIQCWGDNTAGQLGNGTTTNSSVPVTVSGISDALAVAAGGILSDWSQNTCALVSGGAVLCWGNNHSGQLGNGTTTGGTVPVMVSGITNAVAIATGGGHSCATLGDGTVQCWGLGTSGVLGNGSWGPNACACTETPVTVSGIANALAVAAGSAHTCALLNGGTVQCWGSNQMGQLGDGTTTASNVPVTVVGF